MVLSRCQLVQSYSFSTDPERTGICVSMYEFMEEQVKYIQISSNTFYLNSQLIRHLGNRFNQLNFYFIVSKYFGQKPDKLNMLKVYVTCMKGQN